MLTRKYEGSIVINGSPRKVEVSGDAINRTTIRLDGITVFDKTSLFGNRPIDFVPIPGKKAVLRWQKNAAMFECAVTVDGETNKVPRLEGNGRPISLENQARIGAVACLLFGMMSLTMNYYDLKTGHYWTSLGTEPFFIMAGLAGLFFPRTLANWKPKMEKLSKPKFAIIFVLFFVGAWLMKDWLMTWMTQH